MAKPKRLIMNKEAISKIGLYESGSDNWKTVREALLELWEKHSPETEPKKGKKS